MEEPRKKITFSIQEDPEILELVDRLVAVEGTTRAAVYRRAMRRFLLPKVPTSRNIPEVETTDIVA